MKSIAIVALICPWLVATVCNRKSETCTEEETTCLLQVVSRVRGTGRSTAVPGFASFINKYGRSYKEGSEEYEMRGALYLQRLHRVQNHNSNPQRRWTAGINHLSDRTEEELASLRGLRVMKSRSRGAGSASSQGHVSNLLSQVGQEVMPTEKSWAHLSSAKESTDQGGCGSCWALATSTVLRTNAEINGYNRTFSMQELVDCAPNPHHCGGTGGCGGSTVELAMDYAMEMGLDTLHGTPYQGSDAKCKKGGSKLNSYKKVAENNDYLHHVASPGHHKANSDTAGAHALKLIAWERLPENEYEPIMRAVSHTGPLGVSVAAGAWNSYAHGIFDSCGKDATIDHAVTLMGFGKDKASGDKYWLIKNSWTNNWGENGNIRLLRHDGNVHCGTDKQPDVGTGCKGGPSTVDVCGMCGILYDTVAVHFQQRQHDVSDTLSG